jgi:hypothetical protein
MKHLLFFILLSFININTYSQKIDSLQITHSLKKIVSLTTKDRLHTKDSLQIIYSLQKIDSLLTKDSSLTKDTLEIIYCLRAIDSLLIKDFLNSFTAKRGIYTTFKDLREGNPLLIQNFEVKGYPYGSFKLKIDSLPSPKLDEFLRTVVGVSDGWNFYISGRFTDVGFREVRRCYLRGPYLFAFQTQYYNNPGLIDLLINDEFDKNLRGFVININKGLSLRLTKKFMEDIISNYPDLENEYKDKEDFMKYKMEILRKINEREKVHD